MAGSPEPPRPAWVGTALGAIAPDGGLLVAAFPRDDRSEFRVALRHDRRGDVVADVRVFEEFAGPAKVRGPSKTGIAFREDQMSDLLEALTKARTAFRDIHRPEAAARRR